MVCVPHFGKHSIKLIIFNTKQEVLNFQLNMLPFLSNPKHMTFQKHWDFVVTT